MAVYLLSAVLPLSSTTILTIDFDDMVQNAELVFQGEVVAQSVRQAVDGSPRSFFTFRIDELIKGNYSSKTIELGFEGGVIDNKASYITDLIMPALGERGVYFVESIRTDLLNPLYGWHQGHYLIITDADGIQRVHRLESDAQYSAGQYGAQGATRAKPESLQDFKTRIYQTLNP